MRQESLLEKRYKATITNDQMIEDANVQERQSVTQPLRDQLVHPARIRHPGGVVVEVMCPGSFCAAGIHSH